MSYCLDTNICIFLLKGRHPGLARRVLACAPSQLSVPAMVVAEAYAVVRAALEKKGEPIGSEVLVIGATALAGGATLVTNNTREFRRIPGLRVEDWTTP